MPRAPTYEELMIAAEVLSLQEGEYGDPESAASLDAKACRAVADWIAAQAEARERRNARRRKR